MNSLINDLKKYMLLILNITINVVKWKDINKMPFFLRDLYSCYESFIFDIPILFIIADKEQKPTPAVLSKQIIKINEKWKGEIVYLDSLITTYNRKRLIEKKVSFIIPGNQMYLPMLGIALKEHYKMERKKKIIFNPSVQALILYILYNKIKKIIPTEAAKKLNYSNMTMTRAFNELEEAGIGKSIIEGKEKHLYISDNGIDLWNKALEYMKSPVKKEILLNNKEQNIFHKYSGLLALSNFTMLTEPKIPVYALGNNEWQTFQKENDYIQLKEADEGAVKLEIWNYSPDLFSLYKNVDKLSLYLSLKDTKDERVQSALDEMFKGMSW